MTPLGGFFELEPQSGSSGIWHPGAAALTSGRACLRKILETMKPARLLAPFYICDAALAPARTLGIPVEFYPLAKDLRPMPENWPADAAVLCVNYFDVHNATADSMAATLGSMAIIDDSQAFFRRTRGAAFSFNSARKFFGVPDGAYAYGPGLAGFTPAVRREHVRFEHLESRRLGRHELAYRQYLEAEADVSGEVVAPSEMGERLLAGIAYADARVARRRNFAAVHQRLSCATALDARVWPLDADAAPFCYPFLPKTRDPLHEQLWAREIFVPRLWPDVLSRPGAGFEWERDLASRLLPLPIDHRYGGADMTRMCDAVLEAIG